MKRKEAPSPEKISTINATANPEKMSRMEVSVDDQQKDEKYDRQLRLWGHNGQANLEKAHVCLLNVTAAGTEALKCLILPGIGKFSVVDDGVVSEEDLGNNFFFSSEFIGQSKAETAHRLLQELNPDSVGTFLNRDPIGLLDNDPEFFKTVTVVICSRVNEHDLLKLGNFLWHINVPLVVCENLGFFGLLRVVVKEHVVVQSHPDNTFDDLRLDCPFPELLEYMNCLKLDNMDRLEHSHTPFLVILYKYLEKWRTLNNTTWPKTYQEKRQIKELIRSDILKNENGVTIHEENFEEAIQNVNSAFTRTNIPSDLRSILEDGMANHPMNAGANAGFWILVRALKEFVNQQGVLPLRGAIPDMFSDSKRYIDLQNIYKSKANIDTELVDEFVREALGDLQLPQSYVSEDEVKQFCKNAFFLKVQRGLSVHDEIKQDMSDHKIKDGIEAVSDNCIGIYLVFRAVNHYANRGNFPGLQQSEASKELENLKRITGDLITELSLQTAVPSTYLEELYRSNVSEIHTTAAIMGGLCSQEVIKLVTRQFVPIDNLYIYDGLTHQGATIKL